MTHICPGRDSNTVPSSFEPEPDRMNDWGHNVRAKTWHHLSGLCYHTGVRVVMETGLAGHVMYERDPRVTLLRW